MLHLPIFPQKDVPVLELRHGSFFINTQPGFDRQFYYFNSMLKSTRLFLLPGHEIRALNATFLDALISLSDID